MKTEYAIGVVVVTLVVVGLAVVFASPGKVQDLSQKAGLSAPQPYTEIVNPTGFVNTDGIMLKDLIGKKVIIVDFLTYSCINCQRTFPYLNAWYAKYKDQGLEIVGIHTPEFAFEKDINNVRDAMKQFGITFPIVLDNNYATWNAYGNQYWPRKYIIDIHGNVVYDHIGEGGYEETEMKIRELLEERAQVLGSTADVSGSLASASVPDVTIDANSPETYFGSARNQYLANGKSGASGPQTFTLPTSYKTNALYLGGMWNMYPEYAESSGAVSVVYKYNAKQVYVVAESGTPSDIEIVQDGKVVRTLSVGESRLYTLMQNTAAEEHTLEIRVKNKGVRFYALTFG